jgi:broad specificity phosphatase PhoE
MRHAAVAYFDEGGTPYDPVEVPLTAAGIEQARAAAAALEGVGFDRVLTSGLPRTVETALIVAPDAEPELWPELSELRGGRLSNIPEDELEAAFTRAFHGVVPLEARFLGGIEQAPACLNILDLGESWIVRAVNTVPHDLAHTSGRLTTMEELYRQYRPER